MKIDITEYKASKKETLEHYDKFGMEGVADICSVSGIPVIAAFIWIKEEREEETIDEEIKRIIDFYEYTEIKK